MLRGLCAGSVTRTHTWRALQAVPARTCSGTLAHTKCSRSCACTDEAALHAGGKGVFSKPSYITIGTKERPEEYDKKVPVRSSEKGKQVRQCGGHSRPKLFQSIPCTPENSKRQTRTG